MEALQGFARAKDARVTTDPAGFHRCVAGGSGEELLIEDVEMTGKELVPQPRVDGAVYAGVITLQSVTDPSAEIDIAECLHEASRFATLY